MNTTHEVLFQSNRGLIAYPVVAHNADEAEVIAISQLPDHATVHDRCVMRTYEDGVRLAVKAWRKGK